MGSENGSAVDEKPVHGVTITEGFYMAKYEVTQAEWRAVMGNNPSAFKGDNLPVEMVSWTDAYEFIQKLNQMNDGYTYRLPTEAEWEYACRAGTTTNFAFGDSLSSDQANFWNYPKEELPRKTFAVGSFAPNAFGIYDMHGNVRELCEDWYHRTYAAAPTDGSAWLSGGVFLRVVRGGSWGDAPAWSSRSASREGATPDYRSWAMGFRVVAVR